MKTILTLLWAALAIPVLSQNLPGAPSTRKLMYLPAKPTDTVIKINPYYIQPRKLPTKPKSKKWQPGNGDQEMGYDDHQRLLNGLLNNRSPIDRMPNAIWVDSLNPPDIFVGNNGQGFDIYESRLDRMPILKPDSSNAAMRTRNFNGKTGRGDAPRIRIIPTPRN